MRWFGLLVLLLVIGGCDRGPKAIPPTGTVAAPGPTAGGALGADPLGTPPGN